jgi:hypothetical protein
MVGGYDLSGNPFYIPRIFTIPNPSGFTVDGIPFYDAATLITQPGMMIKPSVFKNSDLDEDEVWEDLLILNDFEGKPTAILKRLEKVFVAKLSKSLKATQPKLMTGLTANRPPFQMPPRIDLKPLMLINVQDPPNLQIFLSECIEASQKKNNGFRVTLDPSTFEFSSVTAAITKAFSIRYKSKRVDHEEREVYISTEPNGIFQAKLITQRFAGEGVISVDVTFSPNKMIKSKVIIKGALHVLDNSGFRIATATLIGRRQGFIAISANSIDAGWAMPEHRKAISLKISNLSGNIISVGISLKTDMQNSLNTGKDAPAFKLKDRSFRLLPYESKYLPISFEPSVLGYFTDILSIVGPGGDLLICNLNGTAGIPFAIYPESHVNVTQGMESLTTERSAFINKYDYKRANIYSGFDAAEAKVLTTIINAQIDAKIRKETHTIDFGLSITPQNVEITRYLTFLNMDEQPLTLSIYSHSIHVKVPYLIRILGKSATSISASFFKIVDDERISGNFNCLIDVSCPDFENLPIHVRAFVGQPVYFPVWERIFFKPCKRLGEEKSIILNLVNESQYEIRLSSIGLSGNDQNEFTSSLPNEKDTKQARIAPFGLIPINFQFTANKAGIFSRTVSLKLHEPFDVEVCAIMQSRSAITKNMTLYGICIDSTRDPINCIEAITKYIGNIGIHSEEESFKEFTIHTTAPKMNENFVEFKIDPYVSDIGTTAGIEDSLCIQNKGSSIRTLRLFGSPCFNFTPSDITIQSGETLKIDYQFTPPHDIARTVTVYGFFAVYDISTSIVCTTQVLKRMSSGVLVLPLVLGDDKQIPLDFGNIEVSSGITSTKYLLLCNPHLRTYRWKIKGSHGKPKSDVFEWILESGDISAFETFSIPFKFVPSVSGRHEYACDVVIFDTNDRNESTLSTAHVLLTGCATLTSLTGAPDLIEFNNTLINTIKRIQFTINNPGTVTINVNTFVKAPYTINPSSYNILSKSKKQFEVSFSPLDNRLFSEQLQIFANQFLYSVSLTGFGGVAKLASDKYSVKPINFGACLQSTITWTSVYLTNYGSLPLVLVGISSSEGYKCLKTMFVEAVNVVPQEIYQLKDSEQLLAKRNFWALLRQKIKFFRMFKKLFEGSKRVFNDSTPISGINYIKSKLSGIGIEVQNHGDIFYDRKLIQEVISLKPQQSYHLRIGYMVKLL